jgi:hypothetical protein
MDSKDLRYIVFLLNTESQQYFGKQRIDTHDGIIFCSLMNAKEYAVDAINCKECTRFIIGLFVLDPLNETMGISSIETFGFRNDRKNPSQLDLFR